MNAKRFSSAFLLLLATASIVIFWLMSKMGAEGLLYLNAASQLLLVLMGVVCAMREDLLKRHPWLVLATFVVVGALGMLAVVKQGRLAAREVAEAQKEAAEATTKLNTTLEKINNQSVQIGTQTGEISRVQELNTGLQNKLLDQSDQLLGSSKTISRLSERAVITSEESLKNITGADSVPYIVPQIGWGGSSDPMPLFIWNRGKYILTGVTVTIRRSRDYTSSAAEFLSRPELNVGTIRPGFGRFLPARILPEPDAAGLDGYIIEINTQSEFFTQVLHFRKGRGQHPWAYRYWVTKHLFARGQKSNVTTSVFAIPATKWSDE